MTLGTSPKDFDNFSGAAHVHDTFRMREQHAELRLIIEAPLDHLTVAWLENVQGKIRAGEKNDVQGKERNPFRPHRSQTKSYQRTRQTAGQEGR